MFKDDQIYQTLLKYNFDLFRGKETITEFITEHLTQYYVEIVDATKGNNDFLGEYFIKLLSENLPIIEELCTEIPLVLSAVDYGHMRDAYNKSTMLFDRVESFLLRRVSWAGADGSFYRIRPGDFRIINPVNSKIQKAELFHIKKELRNRIGAYRYSVAGYPCLYLASNRELAWFECGMPKQFSFCQMLIAEEGENALNLVDFSYRPIDILSRVTIWIQNARRQNKDNNEIKNIYEVLIKYIITYPLVATCSVKVKDRGNKYVEEYVFPQLFMSWVREHEKIDGICYKSSLNSTLVRGMGATNVALPVKKFRTDGLDERLAAKISVSDIGYLDINEDFQKNQGVLDEIKAYVNKLRLYIIESAFAGTYIEELIELSECIIKTYSTLIDGNYINSELLFTHVDSLCDHADLLYLCREKKAEQCIREIPPNTGLTLDKNEIMSHFDEFYDLAKRILRRHTVFDFKFENMENFEYL